ncbi:hypothetical protein CPB84DRAFT_1772261 [Gymnopilus junonius]|uniref:Uncharacterized protein n=1 Tax=Gymnopilus junonius TaxID=109634 RepID=A0A9P5NV46_GYMJU|nr:hypothetical protein CPB84DRAFT_1772261 [Gymnopilus junonius]
MARINKVNNNWLATDQVDAYTTDERPRQSVANLIGRFETQNKRTSLALSAGSPSRSSSVISHVTGDSVKEEIKEKREWPPKSVVEADKSPPSFSSRTIPPALVTQSAFGDPNRWKKDPPTEETEVPLTAKALNASERQSKGEPNSFLENWRKDLPSAQVDVVSEPTPTAPVPDDGLKTPKPAATQKVATTVSPRTPNISKAATSKAFHSGFEVACQDPLKSSASRQSLTPLKPQHTGQSVASSATARKVAPKTPATPASAKTPSRPEVTRAKTPTSTTRPKTPSTGLFAPTAASLARSRNAPPPVPTPSKKTAISSSSMDRLSKPTAASKAKIASPPTSSSSRPAASSASRTATRPKVTTSPPKVKKSSSAPQAASGVAASASIAAIGLTVAASAAAADSKEPVTEDVIKGADNVASSDTDTVDQPTEATEESTESVEEAPSQTQELAEVVTEEDQEQETKEETVEGEEVVTSEENEPTPLSPSAAPEAEDEAETSADHADETEVEVPGPTSGEQHEVKDDLEQMVNLLESVSITKPHEDTIADIPDEILEIPDEDEK